MSTYSRGKEDIVNPNPAALIESLRAIGYDLGTALADLIDNSISAGAKNIWLSIVWKESESFISIADDGAGMDETRLVEAMRIGSKSPSTIREVKDLGRFGLGLKTASFSQCRSLSVISRSSTSHFKTRRWDLDHVVAENEWHLLRDLTQCGRNALASLNDTTDIKTLIIWEKLDRIISIKSRSKNRGRDSFYDAISTVENHLSMVFHRFLEGKKKLRIYLNNNLVQPWDPFLSSENAAQTLPKEYVETTSGVIEVIPHVLPHQSKLSAELVSLAEGPKGWITQQGFYVYRNNRLLVAGSWLNLGFQKRERFGLARISIDLANTMDEEWQIDIRKSRATAPEMAREHLARIARWTRERANEVYRGRRIELPRAHSKDFIFTWIPKVRRGQNFFTLNREHPLYAQLISLLGENGSVLDSYLTLIEETIPLEQIWLTSPEMTHEPNQSNREDSVELIKAAESLFQILMTSGDNKSLIRKKLMLIEPYQKHPELIDNLLETLRKIDDT